MPNTPILGGTYPAGLPGVAPDPAGDIHTLATSLETGIVEVRIRATRTGAAITPGATGNFADTPIMSLGSGYIPASTVYGTFVQPGTTGGVCRVETTGLIQLTNAFNASSTIGNGDVVQIQVDFFIN
jgi:hypothetical protein